MLNQLLRQPELGGAALLINEFGAVGGDHLLVEKAEVTVLLLNTGCLRCFMLGDFALRLQPEMFSDAEKPPLPRIPLRRPP